MNCWTKTYESKAEALKQVLYLADDREDKLILRPLSAKLLEPTTPEIRGWWIEKSY